MTPLAELPEMLSITQTAGVLGCSDDVLWRAIANSDDRSSFPIGELCVPVRKVGRRMKVAKVQLERVLEGRPALADRKAS